MALYEIYCDGASRGQGQEDVGYAACAIVIYKNRVHIGQYARGLGRATNNEAEYEAVLMAIQASWFASLEETKIYSDSQLVVNQVTGKWDCTNEKLFPLLFSIREIQSVHPFELIKVPRKIVHQADFLCNALLDNLEKQAATLKSKTEERA